MYQEELATVNIVPNEVQICSWWQLGLTSVFPSYQEKPVSLLFLAEVGNNSIALREIRLWLVISWFKSTTLEISCSWNRCWSVYMGPSYWLLYLNLGEFYWIRMLHEAAFKFYVFKGKWIHERIWSYNCRKLPAGNFARFINSKLWINRHFTRGKVKWVVKLYLWCVEGRAWGGRRESVNASRRDPSSCVGPSDWVLHSI